MKKYFEKTHHVKNNDKSKKKLFYEDKKTQDTMKEIYLIKKFFHFHLFELKHLIKLEHLPEHLIRILFGGNTMT